MSRPLVSLLIPAYKPRHFEIALASALAQAWPNKEILVSDDCPTDEIERICARYPHVAYSRNPARGPNTNLQRLTAIANGVFLKYLMDDDLLHPLCCDRMVAAFGDDPAIKLVFSARDRIDADSRIIQRPRDLTTSAPETRIPGQTLRRWVLTRATNPIGEFTTVMFRKADVVQPDGRAIYVGYRGEPIGGLTDLATFLQLCEAGDAIYISDALSFFRIHADANTSQPTSPGFRAILVDWAMLAGHLARDPTFSEADKAMGVTRVRDALVKNLTVFPDLAPVIARLDGLLELG